MVGCRQAEPGHRTVQPRGVSRQREGDSVNDLACFEDSVAHSQAVIEGGDRGSRRVHLFPVDPDPDRICPRALNPFALAAVDVAQFAHYLRVTRVYRRTASPPARG